MICAKIRDCSKLNNFEQLRGMCYAMLKPRTVKDTDYCFKNFPVSIFSDETSCIKYKPAGSALMQMLF